MVKLGKTVETLLGNALHIRFIIGFAIWCRKWICMLLEIAGLNVNGSNFQRNIIVQCMRRIHMWTCHQQRDRAQYAIFSVRWAGAYTRRHVSEFLFAGLECVSFCVFLVVYWAPNNPTSMRTYGFGHDAHKLTENVKYHLANLFYYFGLCMGNADRPKWTFCVPIEECGCVRASCLRVLPWYVFSTVIMMTYEMHSNGVCACGTI